MTDLNLARLLELADLLRADGALIETGLEEAQAVPRLPRHGDDGLPDNGPGYTSPREHEADPRLDRKAWEGHRAQAIAAIAGMLSYRSYKRLALPANHKDRKPTPDERRSAQGESLDDEDCCQSCIRIGYESPRKGRLKLCSWCWHVVDEYGYMWPQMTMPPVELVRLHKEQFMGRGVVGEAEVIRRCTIAFGTPKKVADTGVSAT